MIFVIFWLIQLTNFLVEYNVLDKNSRYKLTNFSGSTGEALVTPETIYLFVDGRYHIQADLEVDHKLVTVVKLQQGQKYFDELIARIPENEILYLFSKKNSQSKTEKLTAVRQVKLLENDPFDVNIDASFDKYVQLDTKYTGLSTEEKFQRFQKT